MSKADLLPLALSLGDPAGIGPELIAAAWAMRLAHDLPPFFVVGGARLLASAAKFRGIDLPVQCIASASDAVEIFSHALPVWGDLDGAYTPGFPCTSGATLALASLTQATRLTISGDASAIITGPIAKARLAEIGFSHPGQTEFVAAACGIAPENSVMMLAGPNLRTVPISVHIPLAAVSSTLSTQRICNHARIIAFALQRDFGIENPRLAIAALNPHAGENGLMGDEESRIIAPAIAILQAEGIDASGPHPADALFAPRMRSTYDVALCMYHDQALIPLKTLNFDCGVNTTLGLHIIRTSPDHGTAFGIAGKNIADVGATIAAIQMAAECAARRKIHP